MGYYIGSQRPTIIKGSEEEFKNAIMSRASMEFPLAKPQKSIGGMKKTSSIADVTRTAPLFNDPRYTSSTLAIPTDDRTLHGLYRFFAETDPIVGAGLKINSELPLADLNLGQCEDTGVQQHYETMWERVNGLKTLQDGVSEYFEIGDVTFFGAFDESAYMWDQFAILNPDYVKIESTWINSKPLIKLIPDEALKRIVQTQSPRYLYEQLPSNIIKFVQFNQEIPLAPNNTFHIAHAKRPYEARGRSIIKRILKILMLEDRFNQALFALATRHAVPMTLVKIGDPQTGWIGTEDDLNAVREMMCYSDDTEVLTDNGFKLFKEVKENDKIACFNKESKSLEYYTPLEKYEYDYDGEMINFNGRSMDILVTPNHNMYLTSLQDFSKDIWKTQRAEEVLPNHRFRACVDNWEGQNIEEVIKIGNTNFNSTDLMDFLGWYISEGSLGDTYNIVISQMKKEERGLIENLLNKMEFHWDYSCNSYQISNKDLYNFLKLEIGKYSNEKKIPKWIKNLPRKYLQKLFDSYIRGDGTSYNHKKGTLFVEASTTSKELANDIQEIAIKLGLYCRIKDEGYPIFNDPITKKSYKYKPSGKRKGELYFRTYSIYCSSNNLSRFPGLSNLEKIGTYEVDTSNIVVEKKGKRIIWDKLNLEELLERMGSAYGIGRFLGITGEAVLSHLKKRKIKSHKPGQRNPDYIWSTTNKNIKRIPYKGRVWCFTVPTGLFITRRNGKIAIQGNSNFEMDPNFSIIWHYGINIEFVGSNGKMLPVGPELDRIYKLKFIGLGIHEQLLTGGGGGYSQAYINLEVQRQRYLNLQLKLEQLVHTGWFKPIADLCGFYKIRSASAGYGGVKNYKWGNAVSAHELKKVFNSLRDFQDNKEFKEFIKKKAEEDQKLSQQQVREYVYPKLDWGGMSAANDENLKNYVKWLVKERPHLIDDATLARLGKLDRDDQEKAYIADLRRAKDRYALIAKEGLVPFIAKQKGAGGDLGGGGLPTDIPVDMGGGLGEEPGIVGGTPDMPQGMNGDIPNAAGGDIPQGVGEGISATMYNELKHEVLGLNSKDDLLTLGENKFLSQKKKEEDYAILKAVVRKGVS